MEAPSAPSTPATHKQKRRNRYVTPKNGWSFQAFASKDDAQIVDEITGHVFSEMIEAESFYLTYARQRGFDIRTRDHRPDKHCMWVCNREGVKKEIALRQRIRRRDTRCRCKAMFRVRKIGEEEWEVTDFIPDHNHELAGHEKERFLKCNRYIAAGERVILNFMIKGGKTPGESMNMLEQLSVNQELPFLRKDAYNLLQKEKKEREKNGDFNTAFQVLSSYTVEDDAFFIEHRVDEHGDVSSVFWCDSHSREEYAAYGDVLLLDSTYKTNKYRYPLIIFSGVSNAGRCVIFGAGLLRRETKQSYCWILEKFLEAMNGKKPISILTDQDISICLAVKEEFEGVVHRLCLWHMEQNAVKRVKKGGFPQKFCELAAMKCSIAEFERRWTELVNDYKLHDNTWVKDTYEKREQWAEPYFEGVFFAGHRTTGRAEAVNSFVKQFLKPKCSATDFVNFYQLVVKLNRKRSILKQVAEEINCQRGFKTETGLRDLEIDAGTKCTSTAFKSILQNIRDEQTLERTNFVQLNGNCAEFYFRECGSEEQENLWTATVDIEHKRFECDCKLHESEGLPCSHLISCFKYMGLKKFPDGSINSRWFIETGKKLRLLFKQMFTPNDVDGADAKMVKAVINVQQLLVGGKDNSNISKVLKILEDCAEILSRGSAEQNAPGKKKTSRPHKRSFNVGDPKKVVPKGCPPKTPKCCSFCR